MSVHEFSPIVNISWTREGHNAVLVLKGKMDGWPTRQGRDIRDDLKLCNVVLFVLELCAFTCGTYL